MRKITAVVFVLLATQIVFSQEFLPGYVLKTATDTIWGQVQNNSYYDNSQYVNFIPGKSTDPIKYSPNDIYGYRFANGKYYETKYVDSIVGTVFLEFLVNGELDVYFYRDKRGLNHYYVSKEELGLHELNYRDSEEYIDGKLMFVRNNEYKGVLSFYTYDTQEMQDYIKYLSKPNHKDLVKFAKKYNEKACPGGVCTVYEKKTKGRIVGGLNAGIAGGLGAFNDNDTSYNVTMFGTNFLFQQVNANEKMFLNLGISIYKGGIYLVQMPFGITFMNPNTKFGITGSYSADLLSALTIQQIDFGVVSNLNDFMFTAQARVLTHVFVKPLLYSFHLGVAYYLR